MSLVYAAVTWAAVKHWGAKWSERADYCVFLMVWLKFKAIQKTCSVQTASFSFNINSKTDPCCVFFKGHARHLRNTLLKASICFIDLSFIGWKWSNNLLLCSGSFLYRPVLLRSSSKVRVLRVKRSADTGMRWAKAQQSFHFMSVLNNKKKLKYRSVRPSADVIGL